MAPSCTIDTPHARIYENKGKPEWQLNFALSFNLTRTGVRREEIVRGYSRRIRRARGHRLGDPCRGYRP